MQGHLKYYVKYSRIPVFSATSYLKIKSGEYEKTVSWNII